MFDFLMQVVKFVILFVIAIGLMQVFATGLTKIIDTITEWRNNGK